MRAKQCVYLRTLFTRKYPERSVGVFVVSIWRPRKRCLKHILIKRHVNSRYIYMIFPIILLTPFLKKTGLVFWFVFCSLILRSDLESNSKIDVLICNLNKSSVSFVMTTDPSVLCFLSHKKNT